MSPKRSFKNVKNEEWLYAISGAFFNSIITCSVYYTFSSKGRFQNLLFFVVSFIVLFCYLIFQYSEEDID
ncbi:MAG: hypothetical protein DWQ02_16235 [Bacteroidetes bacterium]|nr:MAG: hypothetical protein DWQ02_16235 [Bacteroidota bacterium]